MSSHLNVGLAGTHAWREALGNAGAVPLYLYRHNGASVPKSVKQGVSTAT
jgi:hypothetical protein